MKAVSLDEFRKNLSDIISMVMYANQTILVQKHKKTGVVVLSEQEYEQLKDPRKRFSSKKKWDTFFDLSDTIRDRMSAGAQNDLPTVLTEEIKAVRAQKGA